MRKRAYSLVAINSHADLFSSAAYQCLQLESMPVNALSRSSEAVAKSNKHATATSTILAIELFQTRRDAAITSSKILVIHWELHQLILNDSLTINLRKLLSLISKHNSIDYWPLPPIIRLYNLRNHPMRLQVLLENPDSLQNFLDLNRINEIGLKISPSPICLIQKRTF